MTTVSPPLAGPPPAAPDPAAEETRLRRELAAVYRLVDHFGMSDLVFTHISARLPGPEHAFLINPYGLLFEEITASSLVTVGLDGRPLAPTPHPVNPAGFVIHSAVHAAREDAHCVVHTHTRAGCAVAALAEGLLPVNQMSMEFTGRVGYHDYEGVALNEAEKSRLVADLGTHPVMVLRNHGLLAVGATPAQAFLRMFYLERACQIQVTAQAAGPLALPPADVVAHAGRQLNGEPTGDDLTDDIGPDLAWAALLRLVERRYPDYAD
jgi:ribulose-5-phosphate 4-epimerase/fuculose-1-phosphate aldolase